LAESEAEKLLRIEDELHKRVVGQDEAIRPSPAPYGAHERAFPAPGAPWDRSSSSGDGVGKDLAAKSLAEYLFGTEDALIRVDMSDYMEKHNVSRLVGAPRLRGI
jgi:ATP-dependent Clp protease ATP-binding subunit ClpC